MPHFLRGKKTFCLRTVNQFFSRGLSISLTITKQNNHTIYGCEYVVISVSGCSKNIAGGFLENTVD